MPKDASDWEAASDYDYLDTLGPSDLAWEWLRRNEQYEDDFAAFDRAPSEPGGTPDLIRERWGLRFPDTAVPAGTRCARLLAA
ncbi:hypothetical protein GCM10009424_00740 [Sphingomonas ursincola]|uniref:Transcriptional regulator-like domain-containing protein n=1 Tax=Sphingomonas ursincola TaxID=56361 RepID=A0A7V8RGB6_9SPHN|nr:DUF6499 domain-containing protein [Sphingomonas ursincola]MBA1375928.1 hypothetical protein [Sphingomonas ursincola]